MNQLETYVTEDGSVSKHIHPDGSETAIKVVNSCSNFINSDGNVEVSWVDRDKYSVFVSPSVGCQMSCPFCHLTIKKAAFQRLSPSDIISNVKQALLDDIARRPEMTKRYVKLCWMGMGDAMFAPNAVHEVTCTILRWILDNKYAIGIDGVDISTVLPKITTVSIESQLRSRNSLVQLNDTIKEVWGDQLNPHSHMVEQADVSTHSRYTGRSVLRLFYSLHSAVQSTRNIMVPNAASLESSMYWLRYLQTKRVNVAFHQLFVEGMNDSPDEVQSIIDWMQQFPDSELRVLRYNFCKNSPHAEWTGVDGAIRMLIEAGVRVKVQVSAGSEVQAACGQFLVSRMK